MAIYALYSGFNGVVAYGDALSVVGNNLANVNTDAFKLSDTRFQDLFYQQFRPAGLVAPTTIPVGLDVGAGVRVAQTVVDFTQGAPTAGQNLDVAITGTGFFQVTDGTTTFYTRLGAFQPKAPGASGTLNLQIGGQVYTVTPPITLTGDPGGVTVTTEGRVIEANNGQVGQFQLARFINPDGLLQRDDLLYIQSAASGLPITGTPTSAGFGSTITNTLEQSNVDTSVQLVELTSLSRFYNLSLQCIQEANRQIQETVALAQNT